MENRAYSEHISFQQFSDQPRHQRSRYPTLSLFDTTWTWDPTSNQRSSEAEWRDFDNRVGAERRFDINNDLNRQMGPELNAFNSTNWNQESGIGQIGGSIGQSQNNFNVGFNGMLFHNTNWNQEIGVGQIGGSIEQIQNNFNAGSNGMLFNNTNWNQESGIGPIGGSIGQIQNNISAGYNRMLFNNRVVYPNPTTTNINNNKNQSVSDTNTKNSINGNKRLKILPQSESLPRGEAICGYIFICNNDTMPENLTRQLFGLPRRYRDSVRAIRPGFPIFLFNYSTRQLHGIFKATSEGAMNIDRNAWEDKKHPGQSCYPAQVKVVRTEQCEPLGEDPFRGILYHYDGSKFRLELNDREASALLNAFRRLPPKKE